MSILRHIGLCIVVFAFLAGCKLSPPDDGSTTTPTYHLELALSSLHQIDGDSFPDTDAISISARLLDANNTPVQSEIVNVDSTLGTVTSETALTNSSGYATSTISASDLVGAGTVTVTYGTASTKFNFELLAITQVPVATTRITLSLLLNGLPVNRFKSSDSIQLKATVTDSNNAALSNQIVKFAVELGSTDVATALTDANGVAQVNLISSNANLGAAAATATVTINNVAISTTTNYEVINSTSTVTDQVIKLGHFDSNNVFVENSLGTSIAADSSGNINISAGGSLGVSLAIVDENNQRIMTSSQVDFTSVCTASQRARIDTGVFTINGVANSTYQDLLCGGGQDVITATVTVNSQSKSLSQTINIASEAIGSIEFVSASPESIVLKGTGGLGQQETSTLTFQVKGALGNPLAQQPVTFSLNTSVGNLTLAPTSALTNSQGQVTTRVTAGNVPTSVRVTAAVATASGQIIKTQSDLLSVNTGMPDQDSFSLSIETFNPEAGDYDGIEDVITARLADSFNNPVPDGTTINFTTEGGSIIPSCNTIKGSCSVKWTSAEPRVSNHRITILATAVGHETFFDTNGSNTFDDSDGAAIQDPAQSGLDRLLPRASGFFDMSEAWRDDNENRTYDVGEKFIDFNNNQAFDTPDGVFNGPQCTGSLCGSGINQSLHVRKSLVLVMSGSTARLTLVDRAQNGTLNPGLSYINNKYVIATNDGLVNVDGANITIPEDGVDNLRVYFADFGLPYGQTLPFGTTIEVTGDVGSLDGTSAKIISTIGSIDPDSYSGDYLDFTITNTNTAATSGDSTLNGKLTITVTTPKGLVTQLNVRYTLQGS